MLDPNLVASPSLDMQQPATEPRAGGSDVDTTPAPVEALVSGSVPAILITSQDLADPAASYIRDNLETLLETGIDFLDAPEGSVFFNTQVLPPEEVQKAVESGSIGQIARPLSALSGGTAPAGPSGGQIQAPQGLGASLVSPAGVSPAQSVSGRPLATPEPIARARAQNLKAKSPTERPTPGAGELQNKLQLRPV